MSVRTDIAQTVSGGGVSISAAVTRQTEGVAAGQVTLPAAKAGTLSTRTSDSVGEATLASGHGITTGLLVDVYWTGGVRYGVTVGTVDGTAVPLSDSGAGDVYPAEDTEILVAPVQTIMLGFDGDDAQVIALHSTQRSHAVLAESDDTVIQAVELQAEEPYVWQADSGLANPLTGDPVGQMFASNGSETAATFKYIAAVDNMA